jgi:hypothetical protein
MRNLFFDMEIMFQKHSRRDGGVEPPEGDFKSSKADFRKLNVTKIAIKKACDGRRGRGSVCSDDFIGGREIGTGDLVFLGMIGFCGGRRDYDGSMGTFGWHIGNTVK